jgi:hypothetical protein
VRRFKNVQDYMTDVMQMPDIGSSPALAEFLKSPAKASSSRSRARMPPAAHAPMASLVRNFEEGLRLGLESAAVEPSAEQRREKVAAARRVLLAASAIQRNFRRARRRAGRARLAAIAAGVAAAEEAERGAEVAAAAAAAAAASTAAAAGAAAGAVAGCMAACVKAAHDAAAAATAARAEAERQAAWERQMVVRVQARWRIKKCGLALGLLRCARAAADAEAKAAEAAAAAAAAKAEAEAEAAAEAAAEVAAEAAAEAAAVKAAAEAAAEAAEELRSFQASLAGEGVCVLKHRPKGAPQEKLLSGAPPFAQLLWSDCAKGKKKGKAKAVALGAGWKVVESARESTGGAPPGSKASASAAGSSSSSATATVTVEGRDRSLTLSAAPGSAAMTAPRLAANLRALLRAHLGGGQ